MKEISRQPIAVLNHFLPVDEERAEQILKKSREDFDYKIIVLDDDPTGVQTVHDIAVYTDWEEETIRAGFLEETPMFFILTNSRSFSKDVTVRVHELIADRVKKVAKETGRDFLLLSRGDSVLRGHYPEETEALRKSLEEDGEYVFDGEVICPFFPEGGRYTFHNIHYVREGDMLTPAGLTEFAKDRSFGYESSSLPEYVEEKSSGMYPAGQCICIRLEDLRNFRTEGIEKQLMEAGKFQKIIVNAVSYGDLKVFCAAFIKAIKGGKRFLVRCSAGFPKILAGIEERPLLNRADLVDDQEQNGGIVLIGSHVKKTTCQLNELMKSEKGIVFIEFDVNSWFLEQGLWQEQQRIIRQAEELVKSGKTVVIYTSRKLLVPDTSNRDDILKASVDISDAVTGIIGQFSVKPRFIIAKGGITSSDVGTRALRVKKAYVMGQIRKGIPVWRTGAESKFPGMPYVIFPGNVGEVSDLRGIVEELM